eukprot:g43878.t1
MSEIILQTLMALIPFYFSERSQDSVILVLSDSNSTQDIFTDAASSQDSSRKIQSGKGSPSSSSTVEATVLSMESHGKLDEEDLVARASSESCKGGSVEITEAIDALALRLAERTAHRVPTEAAALSRENYRKLEEEDSVGRICSELCRGGNVEITEGIDALALRLAEQAGAKLHTELQCQTATISTTNVTATRATTSSLCDSKKKTAEPSGEMKDTYRLEDLPQSLPGDEREQRRVLTEQCIRALHLCLSRFPQHYKSLYRLAYLYTYSKTHKAYA